MLIADTLFTDKLQRQLQDTKLVWHHIAGHQCQANKQWILSLLN